MNSPFFILANAQLLKSNCLKALPKKSFLSQVLYIEEEELSDLSWVAGFEYNFQLNKEVNIFFIILA